MTTPRTCPDLKPRRWIQTVALLAFPVACGAARPPPPTQAPAPTSAPGTTPCFPDAPPLVASDLYKTLERYAWSLYGDESEAPPPTTFGTCSVNRNVVRAADGSVVVELGCGVRILTRGIRDELGLEIGAKGHDVLDRKPQPQPPLTCMANGPDQVRCNFERAPDSDTDSSWYVVAGTLDEDVLTGDAAIAFFAPRTLVELDVSVWCH